MKNIFQKIILAIFLLTVASCNNDFLDENLEVITTPAGVSTIYVSPTWDVDDYELMLPNGGNADFKIETMPSWLNVNSTTGKLVAGVATIRCSVTENAEFAKTGIYLDKIEITANSTTFFVPVAYISEGNPEIEVEKELVINYDSYYYPRLNIKNIGEGILFWDIISMPPWLEIDMNNLNLSRIILAQGDWYQLPFSLNVAEMQIEDIIIGTLEGSILLKTNDKNNPEIEINVTVNLGTPQLNIWGVWNNFIDFGVTETSKELRIRNYGAGILVWNFEDLPEWLTPSQTRGMCYPSTYNDDIVLTCNRDKLQPGLNSATIHLVSNDPNTPSYPITVAARAPGNSANVRSLEGNIVDVAFDKNNDILHYITSMPNKLVVYDATNKTVLQEVALSKAPTCFAITEDWTKAAIGHDGMISAVNLQNYTVKQTFNFSHAIGDIAWAEEDWLCYTKADGYSNNLLWINTESTEMDDSRDGELSRASVIKKVPNKSFVVATGYYDRFVVYDTFNRRVKALSQTDFFNFWLSEDGQYTFSSDGFVYDNSSIATSSNDIYFYLDKIGQMRDYNYYFYSIWMDHSSYTNSLWSISDNNYNVSQFDDNYTLVNAYVYDNLYQPDVETAAYDVRAHYVFANSTGTELSVLRKGNGNNNWSVEFIQVTQ